MSDKEFEEVEIVYKTYNQILDEFEQKYSIKEILDYRPFDTEFIKDKSGIVVWLKNGDTVVYFPKSIIIEGTI